MHRWVVALVALLPITVFVTAQGVVSPELKALADTERAFAKAATVKGVRDSFLEFFADDAVALRPDPSPAKDRLRAQTAVPFSVNELVWEPRTGDVAASNDLGWLTGPSTFIDHSQAEAKPNYGNYLSVWRRQPDGAWRVYIDVGIPTPSPVQFAPGFVPAPFGAKYQGHADKATSTASLLEADRALNAAIPTEGTGAAYASRLTSGSRLHRPGVVPPIGPAAIRDWLDANAKAFAVTTGAAESAQSGDLGYSYGLYEMKGLPPQNGAYVRVWQRDAAGKWWIVADVTQPVRR